MVENITNETIEIVDRYLKSKFQQVLGRKGNGSFNSRHEILGVVTEEYHELIEAIHSKQAQRIREELEDLLFACLFAICCYEQRTLKW